MPPPTMTTTSLPVACFAPDLTEEKLTSYQELIEGLPPGEVKDAMLECFDAVILWWGLPESTRQDVTRYQIKHQGRDVSFAARPLEDMHVKALWDKVPWPYELDAMQKVFDGIDPGNKGLRDTAFHLLWVCKELSLDREPLTQAALPQG